MKCTKWPFRPIHITNDGESAPDGSPLRKLTGAGIISNSYLQGIQSAICHALELPTTVIEFAEDGEPVRTDSPLLTFQMNAGCRLFRNYNLDENGRQAALCRRCEGWHAKVLWGLRRYEPIPALPCAEVPDFYEGIRKQSCREIIDSRTCLIYECPLLGYRDTAFPIFFNHTAIGVLLLGQIVVEEQQKFIEERIRSLLDRHPRCFDEYIRATDSARRPDEILNEILTRHQKWILARGTVRTRHEFESLLAHASKAINRLEGQFDAVIDEQRHVYVEAKFAPHIRRFHRSLPPDAPKDPEQLLTSLWDRVRDCLPDIVREFALKYTVVFGVPEEAAMKKRPLEVVAVAGDAPEQFVGPGRSEIKLDPGDLGRTEPFHIDSLNNEHFGRLQNCDIAACGDMKLVIYPVPLHPLSSIAVLTGYTRENPSLHPDNQRDQELDRAFRSFYSVVLSAVSAILLAIARRHADDQLRILGHEAGQLIAGLEWKRIAYLETPEKLRGLDDQSAKLVCRDFEGMQRQLSFVFERARMLRTGSLKPDKVEFPLFGEMLFKWKDIYRQEAQERHLQFCMGFEGPADPYRPFVYGDRLLIEQLLYNLVGNAVKYCHRGTKIYLDCKLESCRPGSPHILSVTDYGRPMEPSRRPYDLYWRGEDNREEGLGIGLNLAKQIAEAHGGSIDHLSELVSKYNVPLMAAYQNLSIHFAGHPEHLRTVIEEEWTQMRDRKIHEEVNATIAKGAQWLPWPTPGALEYEILQPTYKVTISVRIPRK